MRVLYRFGDNDFSNTFLEVFRMLQRAAENKEVKDRLYDKEYVCAFINELAYPLYRTMQCWHEFPQEQLSRRFSTLQEQHDFYVGYFKATPEMIFVDKEIDDLIATYGDGNHSWFVLDIEQHDPNWRVYAI